MIANLTDCKCFLKKKARKLVIFKNEGLNLYHYAKTTKYMVVEFSLTE